MVEVGQDVRAPAFQGSAGLAISSRLAGTPVAMEVTRALMRPRLWALSGCW